MSSPAPPDAAGLLKPRRSAHATIHGYLYQACLGVLRWLDLRPQEVLLCEGDEDLDRFLLGRGAVSEQVKAYSGGLSLSDRAVVESLGNFLCSYVTLRRDRGETRSFVFTTTAQQKKRKAARGIDFDLLAAWQSGKRTKTVLTGIRKLLTPKKAGKNGAETTGAIAWLDGEPDGWKAFLDAVEWSFDAPNLAGVRQRIKNRLVELEETSSLPAETFLERLISHVFLVSIQKDPRDRQLDRKALSDLAEVARKDLQSWERTPAAQRLQAVFDELGEIGRLLHDNTATLPDNPAPGKLLTADYEVIPFDPQGRGEELATLTAWCQEERRHSVLLVTGEGGSGKTRLMIEWCRHLRHQGWHAGFLRPDRTAKVLDPLLDGVAPRLVVIDYAETRLAVVEPLLLKIGLAVEKGGPKLRLILLARRKGDWWANLTRQGREVEDLLAGSPAPLPITPSVPNDADERKHVFQAAVEGFSRQIGTKPPRGFQAPDLSRKEFERILYLHMAALAALQGERIESAENALQYTLAHERLFWDQQVSDLGLDGIWTPLIQGALARAVAAMTLVGGARNLQHAQAILHRSSGLGSTYERQLRTLLTLLRRLYAGPESESGYLEPLQPDLLGEELIAQILGTIPDFFPGSLEGINAREGYAALTLLTRLAQRRPTSAAWIGVALESQLETLAPTALDVAVETGDPVGLQLALVLEKSTDAKVIFQVQGLCDEEKFENSVPLREVAHTATERTIEALRKRKSELNETEQIEYARLSHNLGNRLSSLGRLKEALQATSEAVEIYRLLAQQRPALFRPELARSLNNRGNRLSEVGRLEEALEAAEEAVEIYRILAQQQLDAFRPKLAMSLSNLGNRLSETGRREEALEIAEEAVEAYRVLAQQRPETFLPNLALSLNNLGLRLSELGRREALDLTTESVEIYRLLAQQRPDVFRAQLATSLSNLGIRLSEIGRWEEAFDLTNQAVAIYRLLAQQRLDAFRPSLAMSINNLGLRLSEIGREDEALAATSEAVEIYRVLAQQRSDAFLPNLAVSLHNLGNRFSSLARNEEALRASEEAIQVLSSSFLDLPAAFGDSMSTMVRTYLKAAKALGKEPDETLLAPIQEILDGISSTPSPE
jgi:tetratricopeptide (TPR) repeat protein